MSGSIYDTALIAAIVSAIVTIFGWLASHSSEKRLEASRRAEKVIDVQTALLAEIDSNLIRYGETDLDEHLVKMTERMLKPTKGAGYTPFVPRDSTEIVFEAMLPEISVLPTEVIGDVVNYYKQECKLRELVEDLRGEIFRGLDQPRKAHIYADYIWQIKTVIWEGERARASLAKSLGRPAPEKIVNIPEAAPNRASGNRRKA
jgi:hypothetical protein